MTIAIKLITPNAALAFKSRFGWTVCIILSSITLIVSGDEIPIHLRADNITVDQRTGKSIYQGKVRLKRGKFSFVADEAIVNQRNGQVNRLTAFGSPIVAIIKNPQKNSLTTLNSQKLFYVAKTNVAVVSGKVTVRQGSDVLRGSKVTYNISEDAIVAESQDPSTRVHAQFQIKSLTPYVNQPEVPTK